MSESWVVLCIGAALIAFGLTMTAVSGPMPGGKPLYPPPLRFRVMLVSFGVLLVVLAAARLLLK